VTTDKFAILELLNRYILSIDTHDDAQFADNFHDDATYVSPFGTATGRAEILATIHQVARRRHHRGQAPHDRRLADRRRR
jgi:hypothetical protein